MNINSVFAAKPLSTFLYSVGRLIRVLFIFVFTVRVQNETIMYNLDYFCKICRKLTFMVTRSVNVGRILVKLIFSALFKKIVSRSKTVSYNTDILQQTTSMVVNRIMGDNVALPCTCSTFNRLSKQMTVTKITSDSWVPI